MEATGADLPVELVQILALSDFFDIHAGILRDLVDMPRSLDQSLTKGRVSGNISRFK